MAEFNKYSFYSLGYETANAVSKDKLDKHIDFLKGEDNYDDVRAYLIEHFEEAENGKWFEYPELNKQCYLVVSENKIEFCVEKNHKQYYGKGWLKIEE